MPGQQQICVTHLERPRSGMLGSGETESVALLERVDAAE
jgi:hypothetical protein